MTATPPPGRLSLPKAIGWSVAFVVLTLIAASLLGVGAAALITGSVPAGLAWLQQVTAGPMLLQAGLTIGCSLLFTWLIGMRVLRLTPADLRWTIPPGGAGFGYGVLAGCLVAGVALLFSVLAVCGSDHSNGSDPSPTPVPTAVPTATPRPTPGCGNGIVDEGEFCDGQAFCPADCRAIFSADSVASEPPEMKNARVIPSGASSTTRSASCMCASDANMPP